MIDENKKEIWVRENRLYLGEDNILYEALFGDQDEKTVLALHEATIRFMNMVEGKINILVDLNNAGKASSAARRRSQELLEDKGVGKIALFGLHPVARVLASFFIGFSKKKDISFFKTKGEALEWLIDKKGDWR